MSHQSNDHNSIGGTIVDSTDLSNYNSNPAEDQGSVGTASVIAAKTHLNGLDWERSAPEMHVEQFIDVIHQHTPRTAFVALGFVGPKHAPRGFKSVFHRVTDEDLVVRDALEAGQVRNVHLRIGALGARPEQGRGFANDTIGVSVLWAELDAYNRIEDALNALNAYKPRPSMIVLSGGGVHAYWQLNTFCTDLAAIRARTVRLAEDLQGVDADHCFDLARVLRVPGTWNVNHGEPVRARIYAYDPDAIYDISEFRASSTTRSASNVAPVWDGEPIPDDFAVTLSRKHPKLYMRIVSPEDDITVPRKGDGSVDRSANDWFIVNSLLKLNYSPGIVISALTHQTWASGAKYRECGYTYVVCTVNKAIEQQIVIAQQQQYFNGDSFQPAKLTRRILADVPTVTIGGVLYCYDGGVYKPQPAVGNRIRVQVKRHLGDEYWRKDRPVAVEAWIMDDTTIDTDEATAHPGIAFLSEL